MTTTHPLAAGIEWEHIPGTIYPDGVYVDVSLRGDWIAIAVVAVWKAAIFTLTTRARATKTHAAEQEAALLGMELFPGQTVFTDNWAAAKIKGAAHISRFHNGQAHSAARRKKNFRIRDLT